MRCAWNQLLGILPLWMRQEVDKQGRDHLQELRLRINGPPELVFSSGPRFLYRTVTQEDIQFCVNSASQYSPWSAATAARGYITAVGGHRIGLCGSTVCQNGDIRSIRDVQSLCIRVARDFPGIARQLPENPGSLLILGAPGWGKTTLLRDLCRQISNSHTVCVMDERGELFPAEIPRGKRMDVLIGCSKVQGIEMLLRTMGPEYIAVDEITAADDCDALVRAANCGVHLLATAHAASIEDFSKRSVYAILRQNRIFSHLLILHPDKTFTMERITI